MATYTHHNVAAPLASEWSAVMGLAYGFNASLVWIPNSDGTITKAHGSFVIFNGALIGGAITSLERVSQDGATVYESITGLSYLVNSFLNASAKDRIPGVLSGADTVNGSSAPDKLDGFAGPDVMKGGLGDDVYTVGAGDTVTENVNAGDDTVRTTLSQYTLGANVENLIGDGPGPIHGIGNGLDNTLMGRDGSTLEGRDGEDHLFALGDFITMIGGKDNDIYDVSSATNTIIETYDGGTADEVWTNADGVHLADNVEILVMYGQNGLTGYGNDGHNKFYGSNWADTIYGLDGFDEFYDYGGNDTFYGGKDGDKYYTTSSTTIVEYEDEGIDTVYAHATEFTLAANVENLEFDDDFDHVGHGNESDNTIIGKGKHDVLYGYGGDDEIDGGKGADTMTGGAGDDTYYVDNAGDVVVELADEGYDSVFVKDVATYTLGDNVEGLSFSDGNAHIGVGNDGDNWIGGNLGKDTLFGRGGDDILAGFGGGDQLIGGTGDDEYRIYAGDSVYELANEGTDTVRTNIAFYQLAENVENLIFNGSGPAFGNGGDNLIEAGGGVELYGMGGNDTLKVNLGINLLNGGEGDDTATFKYDFKYYDVQDHGDRIVVKIGTDVTTLVDVEHLQFKDGTLNVNDGNALFDTAYYMSHNLDVWNAGANALDHFNASGWHEGRDPNAWFDTSDYLAANKDVAASGQNPLEHYHNTGWHQGRDPGANFDTKLYLVHNPDVAASGADPLEHFLQFGRAEGRVAYQAIGQNIVNGFDAEYYLMHNPDVAAAGVDPLQHYNTSGWHEGRNPNAWFDTSGYLAHYSDIAAAGVNPLEHYMQSGWHEGRDPSAQFDTLKYLAANGDVAAAGVNPLEHFLQNGIYEGRSSMGDGMWH